MTKQYRLLSLVLFAMITVRPALGLIPGPDIVRECPKCRVPLLQHTISSGNTFNARFWTDGLMLAPMLPDQPWLVKCRNCGTLLWIDEAKKLGDLNLRDEKEPKWPSAVEPILPTEADFMSVLGRSNISREKELYLRHRAWWAANDIIRTTTQQTFDWSAIQQANLRALANLMDENEPDDRIAKAEIYRELKEFNSCIKLLKKSFEKEHHAEVAAFIRGLAEQNISAVREIRRAEANLETVGYGAPLAIGISAAAILLFLVAVLWRKRRTIKA